MTQEEFIELVKKVPGVITTRAEQIKLRVDIAGLHNKILQKENAVNFVDTIEVSTDKLYRNILIDMVSKEIDVNKNVEWIDIVKYIREYAGKVIELKIPEHEGARGYLEFLTTFIGKHKLDKKCKIILQKNII